MSRRHPVYRDGRAQGSDRRRGLEWKWQALADVRKRLYGEVRVIAQLLYGFVDRPRRASRAVLLGGFGHAACVFRRGAGHIQ